jgi:hypothetical protein
LSFDKLRMIGNIPFGLSLSKPSSPFGLSLSKPGAAQTFALEASRQQMAVRAGAAA